MLQCNKTMWLVYPVVLPSDFEGGAAWFSGMESVAV
jgi:hypothetical protein